MTRRAKYLLLSAASGAAWGLVAVLIGRAALGPVVWGGMVASPLIGLSIGLVSRSFHQLPTVWRILVALFDLYLTAAAFGVAASIWQVFTFRPEVPGEVLSRDFFAVPLAVLWGMTISGYVVVLWPLSYLNHCFLADIGGPRLRRGGADGTGETSGALKGVRHTN